MIHQDIIDWWKSSFFNDLLL